MDSSISREDFWDLPRHLSSTGGEFITVFDFGFGNWITLGIYFVNDWYFQWLFLFLNFNNDSENHLFQLWTCPGVSKLLGKTKSIMTATKNLKASWDSEGAAGSHLTERYDPSSGAGTLTDNWATIPCVAVCNLLHCTAPGLIFLICEMGPIIVSLS